LGVSKDADSFSDVVKQYPRVVFIPNNSESILDFELPGIKNVSLVVGIKYPAPDVLLVVLMELSV
jgi:hypothetical protein